MAAFEPWSEDRAASIIAAHLGLEGATLPILHALQDAFGHIPDGAVPLIARALNLSRAEIFGCMTFYHDFRRAPAGRHVVKLCRAEACQSLGADGMHEEVKRDLGIGWNETSADGAVTLEPVFCLGLCACGPSALVDGRPLARVDAGAIRDALAPRH